MKKLILIIILTALTLPGLVFALDPTDCKADTLECLCPPIGSNLVDQSSINGDDPRRKCDETCTTLSEEKTVNIWQLQCLVEPQGISNVGIGQLGSTVSIIHDLEEAAKKQLKAPVIPVLGVKIPGLEFGDVTKESVIIDGKPTEVISSNFIGSYVQAIYAYLISIGAIIAVIVLMIAGMEWMLARGDETKLGKAKTRIKNALIGMVLLLSAFTIAYLIDPNTVIFENLNIQYIKRIDFIPNETPANYSAQGAGLISSTSAEKNVGHRDFTIYDQKKFGESPYGPTNPECFVPLSKATNKHGTGNIRSSGCGVASFAGILSSYGADIDPTIVAQNFYEEGFRPINERGCGFSGTHSDAFLKSSLLQKYGLTGERISIGGTGNPPQASKDRIISELESGNPVIVSYKTDSGGGHYIVLVGLDDDGNFLANNPWGAKKEVRSTEGLFARIKSAVVILED